MFDLIFGAQALGASMCRRPASRRRARKALRDALMATMKDEKFLADAAKTQIDIEPMTGEEVEPSSPRSSAVSPAVIARAKQAFSRN